LSGFKGFLSDAVGGEGGGGGCEIYQALCWSA
jgi:hypothetical protein